MTSTSSSNIPTSSSNRLIILSNVDVNKLQFDDVETKTVPKIDPNDAAKDDLDTFNHPRIRRALILSALLNESSSSTNNDVTVEFEKIMVPDSVVQQPLQTLLDVYKGVHTEDLVRFLMSSWDRWVGLGDKGRDQSAQIKHHQMTFPIPSMVPFCYPLRGDAQQQVPSTNVIGQLCYYCTDAVTPIFDGVVDEILGDTILVQKSIDYVTTVNNNDDETTTNPPVVYMIPTHPGHHSSYECFGGYCYLNHAAACADLLKVHYSKSKENPRVAVLDIDYHCGNGTASIFYTDPSVLVVSIHCHPDYDYPFHTGFANQRGSGDGVGTNLYIPLMPGTTWLNNYKGALEQALTEIGQFNPDALVVSMGLDTYDKDPCAIARAGFSLLDNDYVAIGKTIAESLPAPLPTIFVQEGGYRMDKVGKAAADVVLSYTKYRQST